MPNAVSLTGSDSIQIDNRVLSDLADQDAIAIALPNDIAAAKAAKNGNTIFAKNETGRLSEVTVRVLLGSADDKYLQSRLQEQQNDFSGFILLTGNFSKRVGDGSQTVSTKVYACSDGVFKKIPDTKTSAEGDVEQSVAVYTITFGNTLVSIQ